MEIEIKPKEGSRDKFQIVIDDEIWGEIHTSVFGRKPFLPQALQSLNEWEADFYILEHKLAKTYALRCLARKSYSEAELSKKMQEKAISKPNIQKIIKDLKEYGYINDSQWIDSFLRQKAPNYGPRAIANKLYAKGFSKEKIHEALEKLQDNGDQNADIQKLLKTRYRNRDLSNSKERQKVIGSLIRKGFEFNHIISVLNKASIVN